MPTVETILQTCTETAEMEYLRAKGRGVPDPVIELVTFDPRNPHAVGLAVWERRELARCMDARSKGAAAVLREEPPDGRPFTVVVATWDGVRIFHRPEPRSV
jgi:hypothetical protein